MQVAMKEKKPLPEEVFCKSVDNYENFDKLQNAIEEIFNAFNFGEKLNQGKRVLIKPNLLAKHSPDKAITTHPAVLHAVILQCIKCGVLPQNIIVADSPGGLYNKIAVQSAAKTAGFLNVCEKTNTTFYTDCKYYEKRIFSAILWSTHFIQPMATADVIINLPKLKTHVMTGLTCATKNLFGLIPGLKKAELHTIFPTKSAFGKMLFTVCDAINADLHIVDSVYAHEGNGPSGGNAKKVGAIFAGINPYSVDMVAANIIGINPNNIYYLQAAKNDNKVKVNADNIDKILLGEKSAVKQVNGFKLPDNHLDIDFAEKLPKFLIKPARSIIKLFSSSPFVETEKCIGCKKCAEICASKAIEIENGKAQILEKKCIKCYCCHEMCPVKAIEVKKGVLNKKRLK